MKTEEFNGKKYVSYSAFVALKEENKRLQAELKQTSKPTNYIKG